MVNLLSMIVCIAMLFTGGYAAEDPSAASSLVTTISDVVVTIDGTEYPLNPSIVLGVSTNGTDSALFDFSVPMGDDVLFPVQAKADDSGVSVILGTSSTAHTFSADYITDALGLDELPEVASEFYSVYGELFASLQSIAANSDSYNQTMTDAISAKVNEILGDVPTEEATFTIDGQELTGEHFVLTLDNNQVCEIVDEGLAQIPEFYDAYFDLLNMMLAEMGEDIEFHSYADLLAYTGMEMTMDIDMTGNDTSAVGDLVYHITIDESKMEGFEEYAAFDDDSPVETAEPTIITMDIPLSVIVHDENNVEMYMSFSEENLSGVEIDEDVDMDLAMTASQSGDDNYVSYTMSVDDGYELVQIDCNIATSAAEDGSTETTMLFAFSVDQDSITFTMDSAAQPDGSSLSSIDISASGDMLDSEALSSLGLSFSVKTEPVEIEDRIAAAANTEVYNTDEDIENANSLMMSVMGMAADVEKLQNDESVAALLSAVYDLTDNDVVDDDYSDDDYSDDDDDGDPADLPFAMPEFTWLPEGYELDDSYISEYGYASLYFEYTGDDDEYHSTLYVDLSEASSSSSVNYTLSGESLDEPVITIEREDGCIDALAILNGVEVSVTYYDDDLTDEDILSLFAGIVTE